MPFVTTADDVQIYYEDAGAGRPVVLIHGWPLSGASWEYQAVPLAEQGFRVIAYDRRGFGRSEKPSTGYDYDIFASDLATLLEDLDLRDVVLVGFSMGGGEVARYLSRHNGGGRVAKAVLVGAVTPFLLKTADHPDGVDRSVFDDIVEKLREDRPGFLEGFGKAFYGAGPLNFSVSDAFLQWSLGLAFQASPLATLACVRAFSETDFREDCRAIRVPTLIIHGDADKTVPIDVTGRKAAQLISNSELKVYEGAPHGLFYMERKKLTDDIAAFARR